MKRSRIFLLLQMVIDLGTNTCKLHEIGFSPQNISCIGAKLTVINYFVKFFNIEKKSFSLGVCSCTNFI